MKAVFLDARGLEELDLTGLESVCSPLTVHLFTEPELVAERISGAELLILNKTRITRQHMEANPQLRMICVAATGTDCLDLEAAEELGVTVCNCQAYGTGSVVQHVFGMILAMTTSLLQYSKAVEDGRWQQSDQFCFLDYPISELDGKTLGIVGYGTLGRGVAAVAESFGMKVVVAARPGTTGGERPALEELLPMVDVLTLHCPLNEHTRGLIDGAALKKMKKNALLVNGARGGIVDEMALADALRNGVIGGAAVDVLTTEPPDDSNPLLAGDIPNLILTPHIAWASREARQRILDQMTENISSFLDGQPLRVVMS